MMEIEIEKLYTEAVPNKRSKMSIKHLDLTFRKIGITLAVQQIRGLFFRYDRTKTRELDLEEFRQLIGDIIQNPLQALVLSHPLCCSNADQAVTGFPGDDNTTSCHSDVIVVKHGGIELCDIKNPLKPGSLWSSDDVQVVCGNAGICGNAGQREKTENEKLFAAKIKKWNEVYEVGGKQRSEGERNQPKYQSYSQHQKQQYKQRQQNAKLTRTFTLPRKSKTKKKKEDKLSTSSSLEGLNLMISMERKITPYMDMYGENSNIKTEDTSEPRNTPELVRQSLESHFTRNILRRSVDFSAVSSGNSVNTRIGERDRIVHTYTLPRKPSRKLSKASRASMVHSVSVSRKTDFLQALSKVQSPTHSLPDEERSIFKENEDAQSEIGVKGDVFRQHEWSDLKRSMTLPRKAASKMNGERTYNRQSFVECHVLNESDNGNESFMKELRNKLTKQEP